MESKQFEDFLTSLDPSTIHIDSYNHFILHELPLMIQNLSANFKTPITKDVNEVGFNLEFFGIYTPKACALKNGIYQPIYPITCRRENSSYMSPVIASVKQTTFDCDGRPLKVNIIKNTVLAHVPVMLGSCLCHTTSNISYKNMESSTDKGGYFIINGVERVLVTQRRKCYNIPQVLQEGNTLIVNMRSMSKETNHSVKVEFSCPKEGGYNILCNLPYVNKSIPISALIRAFNKTSEEFHSDLGLDIQLFIDDSMKAKEAMEFIGSFASKKCIQSEDNEETILVNEETSSGGEEESDEEKWEEESETGGDTDTITTDLESISSIEGQKRKAAMRYAEQLIYIDLFPHLGVNSSPEMRYKTVLSMVKHLLMVKIGKTLPDCKDNLFFHRFETSGILLSDLYKMFFRNFLNTYKACGRGSAVTDLTNKLEAFVTKSIKSCMATGKWGVQKGYIRQGVSQVLARYSILGTLSHLHRLMLPVGKEGKNVQIRLIHPSHFGYICLFETPEGQGCGVVLNFTASISISKEYSAPEIRDILRRHITPSINDANCDVWIENSFIYRISDPEAFVRKFKLLRKKGVIPKEVAIYIYRDKDMVPYEVRIFADKGRVLRPFLDSEGDIVYLDAAEVQNNYIAMMKQEVNWDYCELHPTLLFSICAGAIPFSDHIQSPRIVYASSMLKQAIGFFADNFPIRYDTTCEVLDYAQKSMVSTKIGRAFGMHDAPAGINCIVAIMTLGSWNAEDCIILNKGAIDRGLFSSTTYKTLTVEEYKAKCTNPRKFCVPDENVRSKIHNYNLLDERGIIRKGSKVSKKDVLVGCIQEIVKKGQKTKEVVLKDCSELSEVDGVVESAEVFTTFTGNRIVKIIIKIRKIPEQGDKFANINAQKGTCGIILSPEDMPFCEEDGIIPDLLVNPNALPSRMTISMFLEIILGQESSLDGEFRDATPFETIDSIGDVLTQNGYDRMGMKNMIDGTTGKQFKARIFMGVNYYQKLKHMVSNKINSRNFGNVTVSTRQPVSGRSKKGGVRAGEMEVQGWLSHGVADFLREKLFDCSDRFSVFICKDCGVISNHKDQCSTCQSEVYETDLPYASKIVFQILNMCSIKTEYDIKIV